VVEGDGLDDVGVEWERAQLDAGGRVPEDGEAVAAAGEHEAAVGADGGGADALGVSGLHHHLGAVPGRRHRQAHQPAGVQPDLAHHVRAPLAADVHLVPLQGARPQPAVQEPLARAAVGAVDQHPGAGGQVDLQDGVLGARRRAGLGLLSRRRVGGARRRPAPLGARQAQGGAARRPVQLRLQPALAQLLDAAADVGAQLVEVHDAVVVGVGLAGQALPDRLGEHVGRRLVVLGGQVHALLQHGHAAVDRRPQLLFRQADGSAVVAGGVAAVAGAQGRVTVQEQHGRAPRLLQPLLESAAFQGRGLEVIEIDSGRHQVEAAVGGPHGGAGEEEHAHVAGLHLFLEPVGPGLQAVAAGLAAHQRLALHPEQGAAVLRQHPGQVARGLIRLGLGGRVRPRRHAGGHHVQVRPLSGRRGGRPVGHRHRGGPARADVRLSLHRQDVLARRQAHLPCLLGDRRRSLGLLPVDRVGPAVHDELQGDHGMGGRGGLRFGLHLHVGLVQHLARLGGQDGDRGRQHHLDVEQHAGVAGRFGGADGGSRAPLRQELLEHVGPEQRAAEVRRRMEEGQLVFLVDVPAEQPLAAGRRRVVALRRPRHPVAVGREERQQRLLQVRPPDAHRLVFGAGQEVQVAAVARQGQ
jgi:hypothetical protein